MFPIWYIELNGPVDPIGESKILELIKKIISMLKSINYPTFVLLEINNILNINTSIDWFYTDFRSKSNIGEWSIGNFSDWSKKPMD